MSDRDEQDIAQDEGGNKATVTDRKIRATRNGSATAVVHQPHFSQPVRQIFLMLVVLALVGAGGWYASGRVMSIFSANPVLNGVIMGVFVLGVLTCFWQVGQLVHSVSWIERFASHRRNAAGNGVPAQGSSAGVAPRLLAPLAALLGARGSAGGAISTTASRSILDSVASRIDELRDITRYMSNLLIFLGLLGTFYGLAITVPAVVETIRALSPQEGQSGMEIFDKLMTGLEGQLGGMGTAFSSSLLGLAGSLVVGLLELFVTHGQNRFYRELEEWMSSFTRDDLAGTTTEGTDPSMLSAFLERLAGQVSDLHHFYQQRDEDRAGDALQTEARIAAMTGGIETLAAQLLASAQSRESAIQARTEATQTLLHRIVQGQEALAAAQDNSRPEGQTLPVLERLTAAQEQQTDRFTQLTDICADLRKVLSDSQAQVAGALTQMSDGHSQTLTVLQQLQLQGQQPDQPLISEQDESDLIEARMHLRSLDYQLARLVEEMAAGRADMIADLRADVAALTNSIRQLGQGHEA